MRDTEQSEMIEVQASAEALASARASLTMAERAAASAAPLDPAREDAAREWVMTNLAERRHTDAIDAQVAGARQRERRAKLRARPPVVVRAASGSAPTASVTERARTSTEATRIATIAFAADLAPHSEDEDLHPPRLDQPSGDLARALARTPLEQRIADREARDA